MYRKILKLSPLAVLVLAVLMTSSSAGAAPAANNGAPGPATHIVVFHPGVDPNAAARDLAQAHSLGVTDVYQHALSGMAAVVPEGRLNALRNDARVAFVEANLSAFAFDQTLPTGVDRIEVDQNSTANIDGVDAAMDVDIAVIDTGVDLDHPELEVHRGVDCTKGPDCPRGGDGDDGNGHGTHVAGSAAAIDNNQGVAGVAPGARIWAVKVLRDDGSGFFSDVIAGIDYVTANADQIEVANMSLGGQGQLDSLRTAIQNSVGAGVVYVVAAGNDSEDVYGPDGTFGTDDDFIPAAYPEVATISALSDTDGKAGGTGPLSSWGGEDRNSDGVDDGEDDSFAFFSNFSTNVIADNPVTSPGAAIDLLLPGVDIYSTWQGGAYNTISGTSMASPHGAGLAALYIAANDRATDATGVYAVRQALIDGGVAQDSAAGLAILNDPDSNWEHLGWASDAVGDPPTVSWVNPSDGDTVSGSVTIQIEASDTEDAAGTLTVEWRVDGGTWQTAAYNPDTGYYEDSWDTTSVSDGRHTLDARATDSDGNTATATITVTTENTDDPPAVSWINPKDGDTVKDTVTLQIDTSDDRDSVTDLTVEWQIDDGTWQPAAYDSGCDCHVDSWDTTTVDDGDHTLDARATDTGGNVSSEARITVTVNNTGGSTSDMYVWDIAFSQKDYGPGGSFHDLMTTVTIQSDADGDGTAESSDDPVSDASVDMTLTHDTDGDSAFECGTDDDCWPFGGTTDSNGQVTFTLKRAPTGDYQAEVTDVTHSSFTWNSSLDADNPDFYALQ